MSFITSPGVIVPPLTAGGVAYGTGSQAKINNAGTAGQVLVSAGAGVPAFSSISTVAVVSFSGGTTGLTPNTPTGGAVSLGGVLETDNGGTGLTSFTSRGVVYASSTSALATGSALVFDGTNFGVGTASPAYPLDVGATSDVNISMNNSTSVTSGNRGTLSMYNSAGSTVGVIRFGAVTDNVGTDIQFFTRPVAGSLTKTMTLDSSGNLGIGESSPAFPLDVKKDGNSSVTVAHFDNPNAGSAAGVLLSFGNDASNEAGRIGYFSSTHGVFPNTLFITNDLAGPTVFRTSGTERLQIAANGAIGLSGANYGVSGQVLTSAGSGAAATWAATSLTLLSTVTASNSATVDVETTFSSTYDAYMLVISGATPTTNSVSLQARMKIGGSYITTSTYISTGGYTSLAGNQETTLATEITLVSSVWGNDAPSSCDVVMYIFNPSSTAFKKQLFYQATSMRLDTGVTQVQTRSGVGLNDGTGALTGMRFFASSGNISAGKFRLYGIANS